MKEGLIEFKGGAEKLLSKYKEFVWTDNISREEFDIINKSQMVLNFRIESNRYIVKYISKERLSNTAINESINLEDAYICFLNEDKLC